MEDGKKSILRKSAMSAVAKAEDAEPDFTREASRRPHDHPISPRARAELLEIVTGGEAASFPLTFPFLEPISPLRFPENVMEILIDVWLESSCGGTPQS